MHEATLAGNWYILRRPDTGAELNMPGCAGIAETIAAAASQEHPRSPGWPSGLIVDAYRVLPGSRIGFMILDVPVTVTIP
jgi:hypothetical protein